MSSQKSTFADVKTVGIDIGKNTFHLIGEDSRGAIVLRAKLTRAQLMLRLSNAKRCVIGIKPCPGGHHLGRRLTALGHEVRLVPAQYVKPFLKVHKNDYRDAEAIAEAVQRPTMKFVAVKTPEQCDLLSMHRVRSRLVRQRTGIINQIRGMLLERGIAIQRGPSPLRKALTQIFVRPPDTLSPCIMCIIGDLALDWRHLDKRIESISKEIELLAEQDNACQRLMTIPSVGLIISSAIVAAIGSGGAFKQERDFAAWLGLVPRQTSTGGYTKLGRLSKRGNKYLRTLFVQAAHVVLIRRPAAAQRALLPWIDRASKRMPHHNLLATALANKLARIAWAVLVSGHDYYPVASAEAA